MMKTEDLKLVAEWDKTFGESDKVDHKKVTFINRYGITLAADMYTPKNAEGKLAGNRSFRTFWCCEGAVLWALCTDYGRERISYYCI